MKTTHLLLPIAAFALTATTANAFNSEVLAEAGLNEDQIAAFEVAHELRKEGDRNGARDILIEAGVDFETIQAVREAMREHRHEVRSAIRAAVEDNDYNAFKEAVVGSPIADIVTTEDDFERFVEAHELRAEGNREEARDILEDLGFPEKQGKHGKGHGFRRGMQKLGE